MLGFTIPNMLAIVVILSLMEFFPYVGSIVSITALVALGSSVGIQTM
jgi:hypothetical protein